MSLPRLTLRERIRRRKRKLRVGYESRAFCFKCLRKIHGAFKPRRIITRNGKPVSIPLSPTQGRHDIWEMPSGAVHFRGGGSFGNSLYDTYLDGIVVELVVCEECPVKYRRLLRHTYDATQTFRYARTHPNDADSESGEQATRKRRPSSPDPKRQQRHPT